MTDDNPAPPEFGQLPNSAFASRPRTRPPEEGVTSTPLPVVQVPSAGAAAVGTPTTTPRSSLASDPDLPEVGTILDKYRIEDVVGAGGFAVVFRGRHLLLDMPVAIKLLRPQVIRRSPHLTASLCEEARLAARINHPNVVRVFDVSHSPKLTYVVMELIEGESLSALIARKGPLRTSHVLKVGIAVASGLKAGLAEHVIHRDIKPGNIVITRSGIIKIVDLGLARRVGADDQTERRGLVGTPGYMAPEQALHSTSVDFRADIYSLGVTLYHAAVGSPPFPVGDASRAIALHQTAPIPLPSTRASGIPTAVEDLLMWMLAKNPHERPPSYDALIMSMRRALDDVEPGAR